MREIKLATIIRNNVPILLKLLFSMVYFFIFLLPLMSYRLNIQSVIFPAFEIIFIYYFTSLHALNIVIIFAAGLLLDPLLGLPIGTSSLTFLSAHILLKCASRFFLIKNYLINFISFCIYCSFILSFKYVLMTVKNFQSDGYIVILFQYLTTICSYNLVRLLLDDPLEYFRKNAKQKNIT